MFKASSWLLAFTMVMFFASLFLISGCGTSGEPSSTADPETEAPAANTEDPAEEPADEPQPAGDCPAATSVSVESTNGAYADREPISWDNLGSQSAYVSRSDEL